MISPPLVHVDQIRFYLPDQLIHMKNTHPLLKLRAFRPSGNVRDGLAKEDLSG